jgi:serine O-acetyltransferase
MNKLDVFFENLRIRNKNFSKSVPAKDNAHSFIDGLIDYLFPVCNRTVITHELQKNNFEHLKLHLKELLFPLSSRINTPVDELTEHFFDKVPQIYSELYDDANSILDFDPAAFSFEEVVLSYPGFYAIAVYRFSHELYKLKIPILPRLISEYAHSRTGIDINPGAQIGHSFFIDHGTGIVIGETSVIGNNVKIYQGVTLGALSVQKQDANNKRHPTIEDNVTIYAGSTILGGETVIGHDSVIGGNVWLVESVLPFSVVYHKSQIRVRTSKDFDEPIDFVI